MLRWSVVARSLVAIAGGYLLAALWTLAFAGWWSGARADAVLAGTISAFAVCAGTAIWAFAPMSLQRMLTGFAVTAVLLAAFAFTGR